MSMRGRAQAGLDHGHLAPCGACSATNVGDPAGGDARSSSRAAEPNGRPATASLTVKGDRDRSARCTSPQVACTLCEPLVMGVVNVTPDSFSDGGRYLDPAAAIAHARAADRRGGRRHRRRAGSPPDPAPSRSPRTRSCAGSCRSIEALAGEVAALDRHPQGRRWPERRSPPGPRWSTTCRPSLAAVAAELRCRLGGHAHAGRTAHDAGRPALRRRRGRGRATSWSQRAERPRSAGVEEVWIDPGIGFGKTAAHNLSLLAHLDELVRLGLPVVVGTSRKRLPRPAARRLRRGRGAGADRRPTRGFARHRHLGDGPGRRGWSACTT